MRGSGPAERPFVFANLAISVDGKIDTVMREGGGFSSRTDRDRLDAFRAEADVLVVGAATVRSEDPPLRIRDPARRHLRAAAGRQEQLAVAIVSGSGELPANARFLRESAHARILAVPEAVAEEALEPLRPATGRGELEIWRCGAEQVDLAELLRRLRSAGYRRILVEGGGELLAAFLEAGLLDELRVTLCPTLLGGRTAPTLVGGGGWSLATRRKLHLVDHERIGGELFLRYAIG